MKTHRNIGLTALTLPDGTIVPPGTAFTPPADTPPALLAAWVTSGSAQALPEPARKKKDTA